MRKYYYSKWVRKKYYYNLKWNMWKWLPNESFASYLEKNMYFKEQRKKEKKWWNLYFLIFHKKKHHTFQIHLKISEALICLRRGEAICFWVLTKTKREEAHSVLEVSIGMDRSKPELTNENFCLCLGPVLQLSGFGLSWNF